MHNEKTFLSFLMNNNHPAWGLVSTTKDWNTEVHS